MCGIIFYLGNNNLIKDKLKTSLNVLDLRGPDNNSICQINDNKMMLFSRLSINDVSSNGDQPLIKDHDYYLICNGEIYNHQELKNENEEFISDIKSKSDCEIIIYMYLKYGIEYTCSKLDGVFSFVLYDRKLNKVFIARDPYGVRPLFVGYTEDNDLLLCSEMKPISIMCKKIESFKRIR